MQGSHLLKYILPVCLLSGVLIGCYHPPYNNFKPYNRSYRDMATGAAAGTVVGVAAGTVLVGTGIGAAVFTARGLSKESKSNILRNLHKADIQYVPYGDSFTLVVPTDRYYMFNSPKLNPVCFPAFMLILRVLKDCKGSVYIAGFTDNIGSKHHKKMLTQARAETMMTFLWANGFQPERLHAEGYGDQNTVSDNTIIHGSAQNRRLEIQCVNTALITQPVASQVPMK